MRRNFEVARCILFSVQEYPDITGITYLDLDKFAAAAGFSGYDWSYGMKLMVDGGFLTCDNGRYQLTWTGHDLLDQLSR
ncbi:MULTISPECIES: hypothetical protein [Pseudomonas syringae group]|uniref:Uncharacterized protein n=4 Tax=Pseudomonas syringae group TaxID=136849 RepID=A0AB38BXD6_PSESX|nr:MULTISPECIES: hypothetical protein [Pseudomonas syringae group]KPX59594.1 hypothetical protein ALO35_200183 [Pseudomonas amygdali pv. lachrymans]KEZ26125.1 hypothetical protein A3SK_0117250 [Pseudomonas amygdali pv. tabaci str. 6605]KPY82869.1 hypothetical protein ALO60_200042 [Pseudomonas amygdali pv. tabaci]MCK0549412.1 DUF2513 domain-containing protein [Pseudomonas syringae pv. aptata]MDU8617116.1 hypothetical protein [Pseudomonas syringae]